MTDGFIVPQEREVKTGGGVKTRTKRRKENWFSKKMDKVISDGAVKCNRVSDFLVRASPILLHNIKCQPMLFNEK